MANRTATVPRAEDGHDRVVARRALGAPAAVALATATALAAVVFVNPYRSSGLPSCPFHALTGLDCPGCGATRGMYELMHGNVVAMADNNLLLVVAIPFLLWRFARWTAVRMRVMNPPTTLASPAVLLAFAALIAVFAVARNIPGIGFLPAGLG